MTPEFPVGRSIPLRRLRRLGALPTVALALALATGALAQEASPRPPATEAAHPATGASPGGASASRDGRPDHRPAGSARETPRPPERDGQASDRDERHGADVSRKLPADVSSDHSVDIGGQAVRFKATVGSIPLFDGDSGTLRAEVGYIAYVLGEPGAARPVTFLFNGGPGAASAYLNIGAIGPWRLPLDGATASTPPVLQANAESWLAFTDLVFVDPPGTGYSRVVGADQVRRQFWSVDGDADALAVVVRKWIEQSGRQQSPKFLVGESYGGFRVPKIARALAGHEGVGVRGLILISPVLDFGGLGQRRHAPLSWVTHLPSMAATVLEQKGTFTPQALAEAEQYAAGEYLTDLMKGERDAAAVDRMTARVAALTGLDPALVRRLAGRVDADVFQRELYRGRGLVGSAYDPTITAFDPTPSAQQSRFPDPVLDATKAPITSAMTALYRNTLGWKYDQPYRLLNNEINGQWNWGRGRAPVQVVDDVRTTISSDRNAWLLVAHGASDLVTPYFGSKLILDQLPVYGSPERVKLAVYRGGHMFYTHDDARAALRRDAEALFKSALAGAPRE